MAAKERAESAGSGRIEGGIDAVVVGACAEGLAAAAYLGKAGLRTVLLGASPEIGGAVMTREFAPGAIAVDGEHLISHLDPDVIADLGLYKHGVSYADRRLATTYFFDNDIAMTVDGDPAQAFLSPQIEALEEGEAFRLFINDALEAAGLLASTLAAPVYDGANMSALRDQILAHASEKVEQRLLRFATASADDILAPLFSNDLLRDLLTAESVFRGSAGPHEAFSFFNLIKRWSGEASGLRGANAYPVGGAPSVMDALRRTAQAAKVDIRASTQVQSIIIEWDGVAGVHLSEGGQIRTPMVINAMDAHGVFMDSIGPQYLDIEFQRLLGAWKPKIASARFHVVIKGVASDEGTATNLSRRLVYAPGHASVRKSFIDARAGRVPEKLIIEAIFPKVIEGGSTEDETQVISAIAHPLPFSQAPDDKLRAAIEQSIINNLENIAPGLRKRIEATDLRLCADLAGQDGVNPAAYAAPPNIAKQWSRANALVAASQIRGLFFCGPDAQIGAGFSCAAGRRAAKAAIVYARKTGQRS